MTRRGSSLRLLAAAAAVPIAVQVVYFLWSGEVGLSWIGYHAGRDPEIESWAAVLADLARGLGAHAGTAFDHGSQNVTGTTARWLGRIFAVASVALALLLARRVRQADADRALALLAALGVLVAARTGALAAVPALAGAALGAARAAPSAAGRPTGRRERPDAARAALFVRRPAPLRVGRDRARRAAQRRAGGVRGRAVASRDRYWASERKTDQAGLAVPFVNERPVWNPAANGLRTCSSRIRNQISMSMRGFARDAATLRRNCCD